MKKRSLKTLLSILMIAVLAFSLFGCGGGNEKKPEKKAGKDQITVTDVTGNEVNLDGIPESAVVTFNLEEYFAVVGDEAMDKLKGFSHAYWEGRRQDAWDTYTAKFPELKKLPDVGYNDGINMESIIKLDPDVIIASAPVNKDFFDDNKAKLEEAGIPVVYVDFHSQTPETHRTSIETLGKVFGKEKRAAEICDFYEEQMNVVYDKLKSAGKDIEKPRVYMEFSRGAGEFGNSWADKMWGGIIKNCDGDNIAAELGDGNSVDVAPEQILAADPQVIILAASPQTDIDDNVVLGYGADSKVAMKHLEEYKNRPGWNELSAVKNNEMGALYHDLSRHIFDFAGAQFMAKMIHPELFEDVDPQANLDEFFEKYMPVETDGAWMIYEK